MIKIEIEGVDDLLVFVSLVKGEDPTDAKIVENINKLNTASDKLLAAEANQSITEEGDR